MPMRTTFVAALSLVAGIASAQSLDAALPGAAGTPLTRQQVVSDTLRARDAGQWVPAGEGRVVAVPVASIYGRDVALAELARTRAAGQWIAAGEGPIGTVPFTSTLTRAEVKSEVLLARAEGRLVPAGEGVVAASTGRRAPAVLANAARGSRVVR